ncbi:hypothetical protein [uncultured Dubosiella sp.]|uniref:hypothetical protein n=1 Tax=uncultured Dubosiella sp. TaxID=1937011 RepID=UPI0025B30961|nr:hypothetical protein [uncultured Dubosiella sp.]
MTNQKGKCSEKPPRKGPMTVKVNPYKRADGTNQRNNTHTTSLKKAGPFLISRLFHSD